MRSLLLCLSLLLTGCASSLTGQLASDLSTAILNQNDPATVRDGAPAYLLLIDGLIEGSPEDTQLLLAGARLYSSYAAIFVTDPERAQLMNAKAYAYAKRAMCERQAQLCAPENQGQVFDDFAAVVAKLDRDDLPYLYIYATTWAAKIQSNSEDWNALADLPKVDVLLVRSVALDETFEGGQGHLYLGAIRSLLSPALGGNPEQGRSHFERAIELSQGRNLLVKVEFARRYARLVFDRSLHDRLLNEVLAADPVAPGLTLSNTLAQQQARDLLASSADYFVV